MSDNLTDIWADRRVRIGYETAEELAKHYNLMNWRAHPEAQRDATEDSLDALGYVGAIKKSVQSGVILDGHLRIEIALAKDPSIQLPVDYYDLSPDEEALALQVLDATTEMAEPIPDKLAALLERTRAMTADRPGLGAMLERLKERAGINGNGSAPPELPPMVDKAEELQAKWQVKTGDLFEFPSLTTPGRFHRLLCGDCREPADLMRLTDGQQVNGCFTSPPYAEQRKQQYGGVPVGEYVEWWGAVQTNVRSVLAGDGSFFVNIKPHCEDGQRVLYVFDLVLAMVRVWGWRFIEELCWRRSSVPGNYSPRFKNGFEPVYHFSYSECKHRPENTLLAPSEATIKRINYSIRSGEIMEGRKHSETGSGFNIDWSKNRDTINGVLPDNVLEIPSDHSSHNHFHSATFPVALPTFFIKAYSDPGDIWLDPFLGSGTTICAAENEGRIGMGIERLEKYTAVCLERLSTLTGQTPRRVSG